MRNALLLFVLSALFMLAVVGCIGCSTEKKILKAKNTLELAGVLDSLCAEEFPVRDSVIIRPDSIHFDTLYMPEWAYSDTAYLRDTVVITNTIPKTIVKTVTQTKEVVRENTAKVSHLEGKIKERDTQLNQATHLIQACADKLSALQQRVRGKILIPWWIIIAAGAFAFRGTLLKLFKSII